MEYTYNCPIVLIAPRVQDGGSLIYYFIEVADQKVFHFLVGPISWAYCWE